MHSRKDCTVYPALPLSARSCFHVLCLGCDESFSCVRCNRTGSVHWQPRLVCVGTERSILLITLGRSSGAVVFTVLHPPSRSVGMHGAKRSE